MSAVNLMSPPTAVLQFALLPLLYPKELCRIGTTCKRFSNIYNDSSLWCLLVQKDFPNYIVGALNPSLNLKNTPQGYKTLYKQLTLVSILPPNFPGGRCKIFYHLSQAEEKNHHLALTVIVKSILNTPNFRCLYFAAGQGHEKIVQEFFNNGVDPNCRDNRGYSLLHHNSMGMSRKAKSLVKLLVNAKIDVNCLTRGRSTPLHLAAWTGRTQVIKDLLAHGANREALNDSGKTPRNQAEQAYLVRNITKDAMDILDGKEPATTIPPTETPLQITVRTHLLIRIINFIKSIFLWIIRSVFLQYL